MIYKSSWAYSLFTLHINNIFYKHNNYFRFGPIGPQLPISSYNLVYFCYGKFRTINATNENLTIWFTKVNELTVNLHYISRIFFTNLITIFILARFAPYVPFHLIMLSISVTENLIRLMQLIKIWQYDLQKLMSLQSIYITHYIVY